MMSMCRSPKTPDLERWMEHFGKNREHCPLSEIFRKKRKSMTKIEIGIEERPPSQNVSSSIESRANPAILLVVLRELWTR